jgi:hypothetical protein
MKKKILFSGNKPSENMDSDDDILEISIWPFPPRGPKKFLEWDITEIKKRSRSQFIDDEAGESEKKKSRREEESESESESLKDFINDGDISENEDEKKQELESEIKALELRLRRKKRQLAALRRK